MISRIEATRSVASPPAIESKISDMKRAVRCVDASRRARRRLARFLWLLALVTCSCATSTGQEAWKLRWKIDVKQRFRDPSAKALLSMPPALIGEETWWALPDRLVIESAGVLATGERGKTHTWILSERGWVYTLDLADGVVQGIPFRRWDEERMRGARRALVESYRAELRGSGSSEFRWFYGDLALEEVGPSRYLWAAQPGRAWRLSGRRRHRGAWRSPLLALGFAGVSRVRASRMGEVLAELSPREIEEIPLSEGLSTLVVKRRLSEVSRVAASTAHADPPRREVREIEERERGWQDFSLLWRFLEDPGARPSALDLRGIRVRLEEVVSRANVPTIRERIRTTSDMQEMEELFHLLFVADARLFDEWLEEAIGRGELEQVLCMISVLSLRRQWGLIPFIDRLLTATPRLWQGTDAVQNREARIWLEGVSLYLSGME